MTLAESSKLAKWVKRAELRKENDKKLSELPFEDFGWLHIKPDCDIDEQKVEGGTRLVCFTHKVTSASRPLQGQ